MASVNCIQFIRQAQNPGFSLQEIEAPLRLKLTPSSNCAVVQAQASSKLVEDNQKIEKLLAIQHPFMALISTCPGRGNATQSCSALNANDKGDVPEKWQNALLQLIFYYPLGLGLFGFIEPCAIGSHVLLLGTIRAQSRSARNVALLIFIATRTFAMGVVGLIVAVIGQLFVDAQKAFWILFGDVYLALGVTYLLGKAGVFMKHITPRLTPDLQNRNAIVLGIVFGLNIPACAAPLIFSRSCGCQPYRCGDGGCYHDSAVRLGPVRTTTVIFRNPVV